MKPDNSIFSFASCFLLAFSLTPFALGQGAGAPREVQPGAVVEKAGENSDAEKAGLREGDILLRWSQGGNQGAIDSPFDLSWVEMEQKPRGPVTFEGVRGTERQVWTLAPGIWAMETRPHLPEALLSRYRQGQELAKTGRLAEALALWRGDSVGAKSSWPDAWLPFHAGGLLADAQQWMEADNAYQAALRQAEGAGPRIVAQMLLARGKTFEQRNDWDNAEKYYQQAVMASRKISSENLAIAAGLNYLGTIADIRADLSKAEEYYLQALAIREKLAAGSLVVADSFINLGYIANERGDLSKAEEHFRQALALREKLAPGSVEVAKSLHNLGAVAHSHGDLSKAEDYFRQALAIEEKLAPGSLAVATSLSNIGVVAQDRGDLSKAEEYYLQALAIQEKLAPDSLEGAKSLHNLGAIAQDRGELSKSEEYYLKALAIQEKLAPGSLDIAASLDNLGNVAGNRGELSKAEEYHLRALAIEEKLAPGSLTVATSLDNLGDVARSRGEPSKAEGYYLRSLSIKEKLAPGSLGIAESLNSLGLVAQDRGDLSKAEEDYRQALIFEEKLAPAGLNAAVSLQNLGDIAYSRGEPAQAEEYQRRALVIEEKLAPGSMDHAEVLASLAKTMLQEGRLDDAARLFEQALNALESQTARLGGGNEVRSNFRARHADYYFDYISLLMRQNKPELALQGLERSRTQTLREMLATAHIDVHQGVDASLLEREKSLQALMKSASGRRIDLLTGEHTEQQVNMIGKEIGDLRSQQEEIEGLIQSSSPNYAALTRPRPLSVQEIQEQLLDPGTLLLEYALGEDRSYLWVVGSHSLASYELPKRAEIEKLARRLYDRLTLRNHRIENETALQREARIQKAALESKSVALELSRMILGPAASHLQGKRLLVVSDGALQYVPFGTLPDPDDLSPGQGKLREPLMAEHEIVYLPSASVLAVLRRESSGRKKAPKTVAVLADPVFDQGDSRVGGRPRVSKTDIPRTRKAQSGEGQTETDAPSMELELLTRSVSDLGLRTGNGLYLPRLISTRREAEAIMAVTPPGQGMKALDFDASRAAAANPALAQYQILHFATHGILDSKRPELSGLVFSLVNKQGKRQDGFLGLQDIYNLDLPVELVVLSACETGLGKEIRGEGLVGLTRGFMYAGASRVVASLWSVDDAATAELMRMFYRAMLHDGLPPAAALGKAQRAMAKQRQWSDPYYWAGFVLQGEWKAAGAR